MELFCLTKAGIIEPIQYADWAAAIVPMLKDERRARIRGGYCSTVNQVAKFDTHCISKIEDFFQTDWRSGFYNTRCRQSLSTAQIRHSIAGICHNQYTSAIQGLKNLRNVGRQSNSYYAMLLDKCTRGHTYL